MPISCHINTLQVARFCSATRVVEGQCVRLRMVHEKVNAKHLEQ